MFLRPHGQSTAISTLLHRINDAHLAEEIDERDRLMAAAWTVGATAQELNDATGLPGTEISAILVEQGEDPKARRRGWRPLLRRR